MTQTDSPFITGTCLELLSAIFTGMLAVAACAGVVVAYQQIRAQRQMTKQNNSINKMWALKGDGDLSKAMNKIAQMWAEEEKMDSYASLKKFRENVGQQDLQWDEKSREKNHALNHVVDYFELVSVGLKQGIYDEAIIRDYAQDTFVEMRKRTKLFVLEMRRAHNPAYGKNFQRVTLEFRLEIRRKNRKETGCVVLPTSVPSRKALSRK